MSFLKNLKTTDIVNYKKGILPFGATEQHGPFLPLGTDSIIMQGILEKIHHLDKDILILPNIEITCSQEHSGFKGTLWVSEKTLENYLKDIITSISDSLSQIYLLTTHGGNVSVLSNFAKNYPMYAGVDIFYINTEVAQIDDFLVNELNGPIDEHAGNLEISTVYHLQQNLVKLPTKDYPKEIIDMDWTRPVIEQSKSGIIDNHPEWKVSKELGEKFVNITAKYIVETINNS
jgi:creatinine amidohydrolase